MGFFGRTSKRSGRVRLGVLAMAAAIALACHYFEEEDSGSSFTSTSQLEGAWQGTLRAANAPPDPATLHDLVLVFDAESNITNVVIDAIDQGVTGTLTFSDPNPLEDFARFYDYELVDGTGATVETGSFYIDDRFLYGLLIGSNGNFGVLQRGTMNRPAGGFLNSALTRKKTSTRVPGVFTRWTTTSVIEEVGDWVISTGFEDGGTGDIPYVGMIGGDVIDLPQGQQGEKTLENGESFGGNFRNFDAMGFWEGIDDLIGTQPMIAIISFDEEFVGMFDCEPNFPECVFFLWPLADRSNRDTGPPCIDNAFCPD